MAQFKLKICKVCKSEFRQYNSLQKCPCQNSLARHKETKKYVIPKVSEKRKIENLKYSVLRIEFLGKKENQICFIDGCNKKATTIEHRSGRWGKNFLDTSTWAGCCLEHNLELETNPELAKKYQYSKISGIKKSEL